VEPDNNNNNNSNNRLVRHRNKNRAKKQNLHKTNGRTCSIFELRQYSKNVLSTWSVIRALSGDRIIQLVYGCQLWWFLMKAQDLWVCGLCVWSSNRNRTRPFRNAICFRPQTKSDHRLLTQHPGESRCDKLTVCDATPSNPIQSGLDFI